MIIQKTTSLSEIKQLAPACSCAHCTHGCTIGSGILAEGDLAPLAQYFSIDEEKFTTDYLEEVTLFGKKKYRPKLLRKGKPYGQCIFLQDGKCSVHPVKPLQCKIAMGCKEYGEELSLWFMLNYLIDGDDAESIREFSIYLKSGGKTLPDGELRDFVDEETLKKIENYELKR